MLASLFINLAPVCNSRHIHRSGSVVNLVYNAVITHTNTPFVIAACEFLAARRTRSQCETFEARHNAGNHLRGQPMQLLFRTCG